MQLASLVFGAASSDIVTAPMVRTPDTMSLLLWHYPTTITTGRRICARGDGATYGNELAWDPNFAAPGTLGTNWDRASGTASAFGTKAYTTGKWWFNAVTLTVGSAPHIYWGDETTIAAEESYSSTSAGTSGSLKDDSTRSWGIGNIGLTTPNLPYQGNICLFARFVREMTLADVKRWQFTPFVDADCDAFYSLSKTGTLYSWGRGATVVGTVTGATVSDRSPANVRVGFGPPAFNKLKPNPFSPTRERRGRGARF